MNDSPFQTLKIPELTGDLPQDVSTFLISNGFWKTAKHCREVAVEAREVALRVGANPDHAELAGWLHDVSVIYPVERRVEIAQKLGIALLPEEQQHPMLIHQKLSVAMSRDIFGVQETEILSAIGCHTTLRAQATLLDKVLFVSDKLAWDQDGVAPFHVEMYAALEKSIDHAAFVYLEYLWARVIP